MMRLLIDGGIIFISIFVQAFIHTIILSCIFNLKLSYKERAIYASVLAIYSVIFKLSLPLAVYILNPIFYVSIGAFVLFAIKKVSFLKLLFYNIFLLVISIPFEIIAGTLASNLLNLIDDTDNVVASIPILAFIILGEAILALFIYLFKKLKNIQLDFNHNSIGVNLVWTFLFFIPNIMFYGLNIYNYPTWLLVYNILSSIMLVVLSVYNTNKQVKLEVTKRDLQNSEMHNKTLKELNDSIRVFKHDYNNVVHAIGGYIATNDMSGLEKYYAGLSKDSTKVNQLENISPEKINEPSIYGLIASKYQMANTRHINFNIESIFNYKNLGMPIYDFCKILGILLDNAIEAAEETSEKEVIFRARQSNKTMMQLFVIENSYLNKDIDTEKIYEKDYSTKNRNSGLGLWEVKNIVDRNDNVTLVTNKDEKFFRQELYIQIKEKESE